MPVTIRRRELIAAIGGAMVAWPLSRRARSRASGCGASAKLVGTRWAHGAVGARFLI
jgi:hypothetical protein